MKIVPAVELAATPAGWKPLAVLDDGHMLVDDHAMTSMLFRVPESALGEYMRLFSGGREIQDLRFRVRKYNDLPRPVLSLRGGRAYAMAWSDDVDMEVGLSGPCVEITSGGRTLRVVEWLTAADES